MYSSCCPTRRLSFSYFYPVRFDWDETVAEIQDRAAEAQASAAQAQASAAGAESAAAAPPAAHNAGPISGQGEAAAAAVQAQAAAGDLAARVASARAARWSGLANFCLWLHADDVHSIEEVTRKLTRLGFRRTSAAALAVAAAPQSKLGVALIKVSARPWNDRLVTTLQALCIRRRASVEFRLPRHRSSREKVALMFGLGRGSRIIPPFGRVLL